MPFNTEAVLSVFVRMQACGKERSFTDLHKVFVLRKSSLMKVNKQGLVELMNGKNGPLPGSPQNAYRAHLPLLQ